MRLVLFDMAVYEVDSEGHLVLQVNGLPKPLLRSHDKQTRHLCQADLDRLNIRESYSRLRDMEVMMDEETKKKLFFGLGRRLYRPNYPHQSFLRMVGTDTGPNLFRTFHRREPGEVDYQVCYMKVSLFLLLSYINFPKSTSPNVLTTDTLRRFVEWLTCTHCQLIFCFGLIRVCIQMLMVT